MKNSFIGALFGATLSVLSVAGASIAHGWGDDFKIFGRSVRKGYLIAALVIVFGFVGWVNASWIGAIAGALISLAWWFRYRTGGQAKADLDYMYGAGKLAKVWQSRIFHMATDAAIMIGCAIYTKEWWNLAFIPAAFAALYLLLWVAKKTTLDPGESERHNRMKQEAVVVGGVLATGLLFAICGVIEDRLSGWS